MLGHLFLPRLGAAALTLFLAASAAAQTTRAPAPADEHAGHDMAQHEGHVPTPGAPVNGSGTAWLPASTPVEGFHLTSGVWNVMLHGEVFGQYIRESGEEHRRGQQAGSINWFMAMAERPAGAGRFQLRGMASLEPWTIGGCGYPNLLATGELCDGDSIHDRQHPHDLVVELAGRYDRPLSAGTRWQLYAGLAGEPALGPTAYQHRRSAAFNPIAPTTHHWLDSTHITFGVLTTGVSSGRWNVEASLFNGREPDEDRANLDLGALDSVSGRLSFAPNANLVLQVSGGLLREAEADPGTAARIDVTRLTASATFNRPLSGGRALAATIAYGSNGEDDILPGGPVSQRTHALLVEGSLAWARRAWFARVEAAGKPAHDLHVHEHLAEVFTVGKIQGGYAHHLADRQGFRLSAGGAVMASIVGNELAPRYGGRVAPGFALFLSLTPSGSVTHQGN
jgi:hypothetical protein